MQIDPSNQSTQLVLTTKQGAELALDPGRQVVARVVSVSSDGASAQLSLAGQNVNVQTSGVALTAGATVNLRVQSTTDAGATLALVPGTPPPSAAAVQAGTLADDAVLAPTTGSASKLLSEVAPAAIKALAGEGLPVTASVARAVTGAVDLATGAGGNAPSFSNVDLAARSFAALAARGLPLEAGVAAKVGTALELAGSLGKELNALSAQSPAVARALEGGTASATALRSLVAPSLEPATLALARTAQALATVQSQGANTGAAALQASVSGTGTGAANAPGTGATINTPTAPTAQTVAVNIAAVRGDSATSATTGAAPAPTPGAAPTVPPAPQGVQAAPGAPPPPAATVASTQQAVQSGAGSAAAGSAAPAATPPQVATVVTQLTELLARLAPAAAPTEGAAGAVARGVAPQPLDPNIAFVPPSTTKGADGTPSLVANLESALHGGVAGKESEARQALQALAQAPAAQLAAALRGSTESVTLALAGKVLEQLAANTAHLAGSPAAAEVRQAIQALLTDLGHALTDEALDAHPLRAALEQSLAHPKAGVAAAAQHILDAADGAAVLSMPRTTDASDGGYAFFNVPMPNGQHAEVLVRREPGRRSFSFDRFEMVFLLDTASLGTLMVRLDATPGTMLATVHTDRPDVEGVLNDALADLQGAVEREAKRPVTVAAGVFSDDPPTSLLDPVIGYDPGSQSFYA